MFMHMFAMWNSELFSLVSTERVALTHAVQVGVSVHGWKNPALVVASVVIATFHRSPKPDYSMFL